MTRELLIVTDSQTSAQIQKLMGNFKASSSSSGFVYVTTVLILLAVIINIYPAASLKAVEEVAKDKGTTEVASVHHNEIRERVLVGGGAIKSFFNAAGRVVKGAVTNAKPVRYTPSFKPPVRYTPSFIPPVRYSYTPSFIPPVRYTPSFIPPVRYTPSFIPPVRYTPSPSFVRFPPNSLDSMIKLYHYLDQAYCPTVFCYTITYPSAVGDSCQCGTKYYRARTPCRTEAYHCCIGKNRYCDHCCKGEATYGTLRPDIFP